MAPLSLAAPTAAAFPMSFVLHLWREPVPVSLKQAQKLLADLRQQMVWTSDPAVRLLIDGIASRLADDLDPDDYWAEEPDVEPASPLLTLSPRTDSLSAVMPVVLDVARAQGWVVFDGQAGEVWLPDGRMLSAAGAFVVPAAPPMQEMDASEPAARAAWLRKRLAPVFEGHGFKARKGEFWFTKTLPFGEALFFGRTVRAGLSHGLWLRLNFGDPVRAALDSDGGPSLQVSLHRMAARQSLDFTFVEPPPLFRRAPGDNVYELPCTDADALQRCGEELSRLYGEHILHWLDGLGSMSDLEYLANRVPDEDCPFIGLRRRDDYRLLNYHPDLLLAREVNAPDFEVMARQRLAQYEADAFGRGLLPALRALLQVCGHET